VVTNPTTGISTNVPSRRTADYVWMSCLGLCSIAPFISLSYLFETRTDVNPSLRPLLASRALNRGVKVAIVGDRKRPIVRNIRYFLKKVGHLHEGKEHHNCIVIYVMSNFERRDVLFGNSEHYPFDPRFSVFIWASNDDGFGVDPKIAKKLKRIKQMRELSTRPDAIQQEIPRVQDTITNLTGDVAKAKAVHQRDKEQLEQSRSTFNRRITAKKLEAATWRIRHSNQPYVEDEESKMLKKQRKELDGKIDIINKNLADVEKNLSSRKEEERS